MTDSAKRASLLTRARWAYVAAFGIPASVMLISFAKGAGWKPVLVGLPVYLVIYGSITYQLIGDLRRLKDADR